MIHERIEINPEIMFGKPVIKGTRITVEHILRKLAGGMTADQILADYPHLTPDDVYAAAAFAADHLAKEEITLSHNDVLSQSDLDPQNQRALALLQSLAEESDDMDSEWWDEFERDLAKNRLTFRNGE